MLRVIQWATGVVGRHAVRTIQQHPDLQLVGGFVYSPDKVGLDLGDICGSGPTGVRATNDRAEILALPADCVLYTAEGEGEGREAALDDICSLLASGKNVVSTALTVLIYPKAAGADVVERLAAACRAGGTSFHATGVEPGWAAEVVPLTMSSLFQRIDHLLVQEIIDYSTYPSASTLARMGFGQAPQPHPPVTMATTQGTAFHAPLLMVADAMGAVIDEVIYECDYAVAQEAFDVTAARIEAGTVSGKRYAFTAMIGGRPAIKIEHVTRIHPDAGPDWPTGRGWRVTVSGAPSMVLEARIGVNGEDQNDQACLAAAMHAVHAVAPVCAAAPGIRTFLDLPIIVGRHAFGALGGPPDPSRS
jgi:hypothetical protein